MNLQAREDLLKNDNVQRMVAERAYLISEHRNFETGHEIEDWFRAENEIIEYIMRNTNQGNEGSPYGASVLTESAIHEEPIEPVKHAATASENIEEPKPKTARKKATGEKPTAKKAATKSAAETSAKAKPILTKKNADPKKASTTARKNTSNKGIQPGKSL